MARDGSQAGVAELRDYLLFCVVFNPLTPLCTAISAEVGKRKRGLGAARFAASLLTVPRCWCATGEREACRPCAALIYLSAIAQAVIHHVSASAWPLYGPRFSFLLLAFLIHCFSRERLTPNPLMSPG